MNRIHMNTHKAQQFVVHMALCFEILVAAIVALAIIMTLFTVPDKLASLYHNGRFNEFLITIFNIIIEHMSIADTLIGIVAISILFLIRKFLFVSALDKQGDV